MDLLILNFIQENCHNGFTDTIFPFITMMGDSGLIWVLIGIALAITKKYRKAALILFASLILTHIIGGLILKPIVARPRPFVTFPDVTLLINAPNEFSFPSGHAGSSFAAATILWKANRKFGIPALVLASLIAFSRVFLFVHYPMDIIVGAILGVLCALICWKLCKKMVKI